MSLHEKLKTTDLILLILLVIAIIGLGSIILSTKSAEIPDQPEEILYDSSATAMIETHGYCSSCEEECYGFNGQLVCNNQDCDLYGLAVDIDE